MARAPSFDRCRSVSAVHQELIRLLSCDYLVEDNDGARAFVIKSWEHLKTPKDKQKEKVEDVLDALRAKGKFGEGNYEVLKELTSDIDDDIDQLITEAEKKIENIKKEMLQRRPDTGLQVRIDALGDMKKKGEAVVFAVFQWTLDNSETTDVENLDNCSDFEKMVTDLITICRKSYPEEQLSDYGKNIFSSCIESAEKSFKAGRENFQQFKEHRLPKLKKYITKSGQNWRKTFSGFDAKATSVECRCVYLDLKFSSVIGLERFWHYYTKRQFERDINKCFNSSIVLELLNVDRLNFTVCISDIEYRNYHEFLGSQGGEISNSLKSLSESKSRRQKSRYEARMDVTVKNKMIRFRHDSELTKRNMEKEELTQIKFHNVPLESSIIIRVHAVHTDNRKAHPFCLMGEKCHDGIYTEQFKQTRENDRSCTVMASVMIPERKDYEEQLRCRKRGMENKLGVFLAECKKSDYWSANKSIRQCQSLRLCVEAFYHKDGQSYLLHRITDPLYDAKVHRTFQIHTIRPCAAPCSGIPINSPDNNMLIVLSADSFVPKKGVEVWFVDHTGWREKARNITIIGHVIECEIPPYKESTLESPVGVKLFLRDVNKDMDSNTVNFQYTPTEEKERCRKETVGKVQRKTRRKRISAKHSTDRPSTHGNRVSSTAPSPFSDVSNDKASAGVFNFMVNSPSHGRANLHSNPGTEVDFLVDDILIGIEDLITENPGNDGMEANEIPEYIVSSPEDLSMMPSPQQQNKSPPLQGSPLQLQDNFQPYGSWGYFSSTVSPWLVTGEGDIQVTQQQPHVDQTSTSTAMSGNQNFTQSFFLSSSEVANSNFTDFNRMPGRDLQIDDADSLSIQENVGTTSTTNTNRKFKH